jgi:hypothetical protein
MSRYALGSLYNPASGTICGLQPAHFISMATPHCGCDADGVAQVRLWARFGEAADEAAAAAAAAACLL